MFFAVSPKKTWKKPERVRRAVKKGASGDEIRLFSGNPLEKEHGACYINCILHMIAPVGSHSGMRGHNPLPFIRADLICPYRTHDRGFRTVLRSAHFRSGRKDAWSSPTTSNARRRTF